MKTRILILGIAGGLAWLSPVTAHADRKLSPELFDQYDHRGYFTPNFKTALEDMVRAHEALDKALAEQKKFEQDLPALQKEAADAQAKTVALQQQLAVYDHPDENDFNALQTLIHDPAAKAGDVIALAQAYVWTYPTSPHEPVAQEFLNTWQKKLADQQQAEKDAEAAREAAHAALVRRAQAHDLSLPEWRDLLHGLSQDDLVKLFGQPTSKQDDYWFYDGEWVVNPANSQKQGLQINFDAGRVLSVDAKPPTP
jgi:uncharacterized protein Usg